MRRSGRACGRGRPRKEEPSDPPLSRRRQALSSAKRMWSVSVGRVAGEDRGGARPCVPDRGEGPLRLAAREARPRRLGQRQLGLGRTAGHHLASRRRQRKRAVDVVGGAQEPRADGGIHPPLDLLRVLRGEEARRREVLQRLGQALEVRRRAWRRPSVSRTARRRARRRTGSSGRTSSSSPSSARRRAQLPQWPHRAGAPGSPK
mgnify:CR=1 FL=1